MSILAGARSQMCLGDYGKFPYVYSGLKLNGRLQFLYCLLARQASKTVFAMHQSVQILASQSQDFVGISGEFGT